MAEAFYAAYPDRDTPAARAADAARVARAARAACEVAHAKVIAIRQEESQHFGDALILSAVLNLTRLSSSNSSAIRIAKEALEIKVAELASVRIQLTRARKTLATLALELVYSVPVEYLPASMQAYNAAVVRVRQAALERQARARAAQTARKTERDRLAAQARTIDALYARRQDKARKYWAAKKAAYDAAKHRVSQGVNRA